MVFYEMSLEELPQLLQACSTITEFEKVMLKHHTEADSIKLLRSVGEQQNSLLLPRTMQLVFDMVSALREIVSRPAESGADGQAVRNGYELCTEIDACFRSLINEAAACTKEKGIEVKDGNTNTNYYVCRIKKYIHSHIDEKLCLKDISEALSLSPGYVGRLFKENTGMTLGEYINKVRIEALCTAIECENGRSFAELAEQTGFSDYRYAQRQFKKYMGVNMRTYKSMNLVKKI